MKHRAGFVWGQRRAARGALLWGGGVPAPEHSRRQVSPQRWPVAHRDLRHALVGQALQSWRRISWAVVLASLLDEHSQTAQRDFAQAAPGVAAPRRPPLLPCRGHRHCGQFGSRGRSPASQRPSHSSRGRSPAAQRPFHSSGGRSPASQLQFHCFRGRSPAHQRPLHSPAGRSPARRRPFTLLEAGPPAHERPFHSPGG